MNYNKFLTFIFSLITVISLFAPQSISASTDPIISPWRSETVYPYPLCCEVSFTYNGKIYVMGGGGYGIVHTDVYSTSVNNAGELQSWDKIADLPQPLFWHTKSLNGNKVYVLGGAIESSPAGNPTSQNSVYLSRINQDGTLQNWESLTPLPKALASGESVIYNDRIYYFGGTVRTPSESISNSVYMAPILPDGHIGSWVQLVSLPEPRHEFTLFLVNNRIIIISGATNTSTSDSKVISALINDSDGTISNWETLPNTPTAIRNPLYFQADNYLVMLGGYNGSSFLNTVYYSYLDHDDKPTGWNISSSILPTKNCCTTAIKLNNRVYLLGGHDGNYYPNIYSSELIAPPPSLFDLPIPYANRPNATSADFKSTFWSRLTAAFDHNVFRGEYQPFTGTLYAPKDCPNGELGIECYDGHNGTDFSQVGGTDVLSVGDGTVVYTSEHDASSCKPDKGGYGCIVIVHYPDQDAYGLYAHLKEIDVAENDPVNVSTKLGVMGNTGCGKCGIHLHFTVLKEKPTLSISATPKSKMKKSDWQALVFQIQPTADTPSEPKKTSYCGYNAPNGTVFTLHDPAGWSGTGTDPFSLAKVTKENPDTGGCAVESPYLWKFDVDVTP